MVTFSYVKNNISRRKTRFIISIIIIAIVVGMFVGFSLSAYSFNNHIANVVKVSLGQADFVITNVSGQIDIKKVEDVRKLDFVEAVDYYVVVYGKAIKDENASGAVLYGIGNGFYWKSRLGDVKLEGDDAIITASLADTLGAKKGDKILYVAFLGRNYTLLNVSVNDIIEIKEFSAWALARLEIYANITYIWEKIPSMKNKISAIYVKIKEGYNITLAEEKLKEELKGLKVDKLQLKIQTGFESNTLFLLIYLIAASILFLVLVFYLNVEERRTEIGILKALGASNKQILLALIFEVLLYSLIGTLIGFGFGIGLAQIFLEQYKSMFALKESILIYFRTQTFLIGGLLGVLIPMISMSIISFSALKLKPVEVLRHVVEEPVGELGKGLLITGIVFLAMGIAALFIPSIRSGLWWARSAGLEILLPVIFLYALGDKLSRGLEKIAGISGKLAPIFLKRKINRAVLMIILLGIALSFTHTTIVAGRAFEYIGMKTYDNMHFDVMVSFSAPVPWNISEELKEIDSVQDVLVIGATVTLAGNRTVILVFLNISKFKEFIGWKPKYGTLEGISENDTIVFESGLRYNYKWLYENKTNEALGKEFNITTEVGNVSIKIKAILETTLGENWVVVGGISLGIAFYLNTSFAKKFFPMRYTTMATGALIKLKEGYSADEVKEEIIRKYKDEVSVTTKEEWLQTSFKISSQIGGFYFLIGCMLYLVAAALIFITLHKMFMLWRRDIATIRSFGADRKSILGLFIIQVVIAAILAIIAIGVDVIFSVPGFLANLSLGIGVELPIIYAWDGFAILSIATVILAMLSAFPPAIKAMRDNIAEALRIE